MKVQVEELSPIERKLSFEVDSSTVDQELGRAYQALSRRVKIAGFRPGKVPRRILEQRFSEEVQDDVIRRVVERAYVEAIEQHNIDAVSMPRVTNNDKLLPNAPFKFQATVEVKPKLDPKDYRGVALKRADTQVEDAKVQEQLDRMRDSQARLEDVKDRDVTRAGDFAVIDYTATCEEKPFPGSEAKGVTVEVTPGELVESHIAALEGVKVGDTKTLDYAFPADYRVEEVKGKVARFNITVTALKTQVKPELNDAFAKEAGAGVETLEALRTKIRTELERAQKSQAETQEREALVKALVEKNPFEVPAAMVDRAVDMMLDGAFRSMMRSGVDVRQLGLDFGRLRDEMRPRALDEVKGALLFEAIAQKESIEASDEDLEKKYAELAEQSGAPVATVKTHFRSADEQRSLKARIREEKTIEFLKSHATYS